MIAKNGSRGCALFAGKSATFVAFGRDTRAEASLGPCNIILRPD